jgi:hypothetical protein
VQISEKGNYRNSCNFRKHTRAQGTFFGQLEIFGKYGNSGNYRIVGRKGTFENIFLKCPKFSFLEI